MASMATPEAMTAVCVRVHKEALSGLAIQSQNINEMRQHNTRLQVDGRVNHAVAGVGPNAVAVPVQASNLTELAEVGGEDLRRDGG
jgi:hypothetical protein